MKKSSNLLIRGNANQNNSAYYLPYNHQTGKDDKKKKLQMLEGLWGKKNFSELFVELWWELCPKSY